MTNYEKSLTAINEAYESEDYDAYEARIERAAAKFGKPAWMVEDDATDARLLGIEGN